MAFKLPSFGKKGKIYAEKAAKANPADRVSSLSKQGFSELEIIRMMRQEGYSPMEVDEGLRESLKAAAAPARPAEPASRTMTAEQWRPEPMPAPEMPELQPVEETGVGLPRIPGVPAFEPRPAEEFQEEYQGPEPIYPEEMPPARPSGRADRGAREREMEDLAEVIVDEKMDAVREKIIDINDKIKEMAGRIAQLEARMEKMGGREETDVDEIKRKIDSYGESIDNMGTKVEGIESALRDNLQSMLQTMRSLSDAVKETRGRE